MALRGFPSGDQFLQSVQNRNRFGLSATQSLIHRQSSGFPFDAIEQRKKVKRLARQQFADGKSLVKFPLRMCHAARCRHLASRKESVMSRKRISHDGAVIRAEKFRWPESLPRSPVVAVKFIVSVIAPQS